MTIDDLKVFCSDSVSKYGLSKPHLFIHPETQRKYSFATDGHRCVIVDGHMDGLEGGGPNIAMFMCEPQGVTVDTERLKAFLECDKPTREECRVERCQSGTVYCWCDRCDNEHEYECSCDGKPVKMVNRGWLGPMPINRALLAECVLSVTDATVRILARKVDELFHVFASDRHIVMMPMTDVALDRLTQDFKDAPRFELPTT